MRTRVNNFLMIEHCSFVPVNLEAVGTSSFVQLRCIVLRLFRLLFRHSKVLPNLLLLQVGKKQTRLTRDLKAGPIFTPAHFLYTVDVQNPNVRTEQV